MVYFYMKSEAQLRRWMQANPEKVNDTDKDKHTPLYAAAYYLKSLPLVLWLLDVKGADVDARLLRGQTVLAVRQSFDIFNALLDRGADPTLLDVCGMSPLMHHARYFRVVVMGFLMHTPGTGCVGMTSLGPSCRVGKEEEEGKKKAAPSVGEEEMTLDECIGVSAYTSEEVNQDEIRNSNSQQQQQQQQRSSSKKER
jgi:hypothetical protein